MWWSDVEITIYSEVAQPARLEKALLQCPASGPTHLNLNTGKTLHAVAALHRNQMRLP